METSVSPVTIGRPAELRRLREAVRACAEGQSRFVLLTGDAGIGKTRLATDAAQAARDLNLPVLWGSCAIADLSLPYLPYVEAIGNQLNSSETTALGERLGPARVELAALFPQFYAGGAPVQLDPSDASQSRLRLYEAVVQLLREMAGRNGLVLVIDDLQWADSATLELLDFQVRRLQTLPELILATCRTDELGRQHPLRRLLERWRRTPATVSIELGGLDEEAVNELVRELAGADRVARQAARLLHERCGGNPYAIEEILKASLDPGRGADRLQPETLKLPRSVRDTLLARLERLPTPAIELLRAASVLRSPFHHRTLKAVLGWDDARVQETLGLTVKEQFIEEDANSLEEYRFRHQLTRDAVYEDMVAPQREALHLRAADALGADSSTPAIDLAHHMLAAHRWEAAIPLALEAAEAAGRTHAYADAARLYERVLPLLSGADAAQVRCEMGTTLLLAGDTGRALDHLTTGVGTLEATGRPADAAHHRLALGRCLWEQGDVAGARREYEQARSDLAPAGPGADLALAYVRLASLASFELDGPRTVELASEAERLAAAAGADPPRIWAYNYHGLGLVQLGHVDEGLSYLDRSYREAHQLGLNVVAANAAYNSAIVLNQHFRPREALNWLHALKAIQAGSMASLQSLRAEGMIRLWGTGEPELARTAYEEALTQARAGDQTHFVRWIETQLAAAYLQLDDIERAAHLLPPDGAQPEGQDRVVEIWTRIRLDLVAGRLEAAGSRSRSALENQAWPPRVRLFVGDVAVEALTAAQALDGARRAIDWCRAAGPAPEHPYLLRMEGRVALSTGDAATAVDRLSRAAGAWGEAGARHEEAWTRLALADALWLGRDGAAGRGELRTGLASARERGARLEERSFMARLRERRPAVSLNLLQEALEDLRDPSSPALDRLRAAAGLGIGGRELAEALAAAIERAAALSDPRDAEAGRVLREYYVRRIGSHELVAERLHLSRTTFYRRLHRGWELVAAALTSTAS